ncbi:MAG TPA: permease [Steroidobacteraceae bacterium]
MAQIGQSLYVSAGLFWQAFWALAFGYAFSSLIQVLVPRELIAKYLGRPGLKETALAMLLGPASSACSFAALSAGRALFAKGAALVPMMAFLFGSTNLAPPVAALAWIFLGWQFALALVLGSVAHVAVMWVVVRLTYPAKMVARAQRSAERTGERRSGMHGDPTEGLPRHWREKLQSTEARRRIGITYRSEWRMVWKDLFFGFLVAGVVATLVPDAVFRAIFPTELPLLLLVPLHALLGPALAILTIIGSMGNGPLAAVLWENGVLFSGIIAFLYADFVVIPSLRINAAYYGWRFAAYLAAVFAVSAVGAGIIMHALFSALGLIPEAQAGRVQELAQFQIDYVFFLNMAALAVSGVLIWLGRRREAVAEHGRAQETTD